VGLVYFYSNNIEISTLGWVIALGSVFILIKFIEIHRIRNWWAITENSFIENRGIVNKNIREIEFESISDLSLNQGLHKRILGYGTINIRRFLNEAAISVPNINKPEVFLNLLQEAIKLNKSKSK